MCPPNTVGRTCGECNYTYWGWNETVGCQVMDYFIFFQFDMLNGDAVVHAHCSTDKDRNLRWLDWFFFVVYIPRLSINYVGMSSNVGGIPPKKSSRATLTSKNANWPDLSNTAKCNLIR